MEVKAESIKPYTGDGRGKGEQVRDMFDNIAPAYDFMNRAMTLGIDKLWRRRAVKLATGAHPREILDVATGTGDLAIALARRMPEARVTGVDLSEGMLEIGRKKVEAEGLSGRVTLTTGDCLSLPFDDNTYDCVTVAYGVRNFQDLKAGYKEILRVLRPGGLMVVTELSTPTAPVVRTLYKLYTRHIIPVAGRLVSKDTRAYTYLPESIAAVPQRGDMVELILEAGFGESEYLPLTLGTCMIYKGLKK